MSTTTITMLKTLDDSNHWAVVTFEISAEVKPIDCGREVTRMTTCYSLTERLTVNDGDRVICNTEKKINLGMGYNKEMAVSVMLEKAANLSSEMGYAAV